MYIFYPCDVFVNILGVASLVLEYQLMLLVEMKKIANTDCIQW